MKVLITGSNGQLGTDLKKALCGFEVIPLTHADIEITDIESVKKSCYEYKPEIIINTAAFVRVDDCEDNPDKAFLVNALGARNVAVVAEELGAKLVQISTDYVFGGNPTSKFVANEVKQSPALLPDRNRGYTEFDTPDPINIYGQSKLAGEDYVRHLCHKHFIIRGSGLFGVAGSSGKGNTIDTLLQLGKYNPELRVVNDRIFSPTFSKDLANKLAQLISTDYYGIFHITNDGICSWFEFAKEIVRLAGLPTKVIPITSDQYPQKARRPAHSVLDCFQLRILGMFDLRKWEEALQDYLNEKRL